MSAGSAPCAAGRSIAFESATEVASVALLDADRVIGERRVDALQRHAATLLVGLDALLAEAGEKLEDYERIAVSVGPGSFTGLRIGLALALGLCFGTERRIVPVSTLADWVSDVATWSRWWSASPSV